MFIFTFEFVGSKINQHNVPTQQQQKSAEVKYDSFILFKFSVWLIMKLDCILHLRSSGQIFVASEHQEVGGEKTLNIDLIFIRHEKKHPDIQNLL